MKMAAAAVAAATACAFALPAFAEDTTSATPVRDRVQQGVDAVCANVEKRVDERVSKFDGNKGRHVEAYRKLKDRVSGAVDKWTAAGYDTTKLKADLATLDGKIQTFATDYAAFIAQLKTTRTFACGHSNGDFVRNLGSARTLLQTVQKDSQAVRSFWVQAVRPDILALKKQRAADRAASSTGDGMKGEKKESGDATETEGSSEDRADADSSTSDN